MSSITRELVRWVDGAVLFAFMVGAAAAYIDPAIYWFGALLAIALPLLSILLLLLALVMWWRHRRLAAGVHLLLVLLVLSRHASLERAFTPEPSELDLVLMTWNSPRSPESTSLGEKVAELVRSLDPDLIALQEASIFAYKREPERIRAHPKHRPLIESLHYSMHPPRTGPPGKKWLAWRQPLLSRFEIDHQEQLSFRREREPLPLKIMRTEFTWQGKKIAHYNVHLSSNGFAMFWRERNKGFGLGSWLARVREIKRSYRRRVWEVARIRELIDQESHPVILSGDFNSTPDGWIYRRLATGLQDAYRASGGGWGATYHASRPAVRIDFVLLGPEFEAVDAAVPPLPPGLSDHRPLVARFRWRDG
jgi:endonuclease/exonuclease/phosphatase family metal-dependent hydrolase